MMHGRCPAEMQQFAVRINNYKAFAKQFEEESRQLHSRLKFK